MDLLKLIDDANRTTTVPETEKWSVTVEDGQKAWQCSTRTIDSVATNTLHTQSVPVKSVVIKILLSPYIVSMVTIIDATLTILRDPINRLMHQRIYARATN
jgi:hypothetical protein